MKRDLFFNYSIHIINILCSIYMTKKDSKYIPTNKNIEVKRFFSLRPVRARNMMRQNIWFSHQCPRRCFTLVAHARIIHTEQQYANIYQTLRFQLITYENQFILLNHKYFVDALWGHIITSVAFLPWHSGFLVRQDSINILIFRSNLMNYVNFLNTFFWHIIYWTPITVFYRQFF